MVDSEAPFGCPIIISSCMKIYSKLPAAGSIIDGTDDSDALYEPT